MYCREVKPHFVSTRFQEYVVYLRAIPGPPVTSPIATKKKDLGTFNFFLEFLTMFFFFFFSSSYTVNGDGK